MTDKKSGSEKLLYCSFCGKSQHEVKKLIAGPPNLFPPHTLSVSATFGYAGQDQVQVVEDFFVEGEVILGASFSVDLVAVGYAEGLLRLAQEASRNVSARDRS